MPFATLPNVAESKTCENLVLDNGPNNLPKTGYNADSKTACGNAAANAVASFTSSKLPSCTCSCCLPKLNCTVVGKNDAVAPVIVAAVLPIACPKNALPASPPTPPNKVYGNDIPA